MQAMCFVKNITVMFLVGFLVEINNRLPASQAQFPQFHVIECFCVVSNKRSDHGTL